MMFTQYSGAGCTGNTTGVVKPFLGLLPDEFATYFKGECTELGVGNWGLMNQTDRTDFLSCFDACLPGENNGVCVAAPVSKNRYLFDVMEDPSELDNLVEPEGPMADLLKSMSVRMDELAGEEVNPTFKHHWHAEEKAAAGIMFDKWGALMPYREWYDTGDELQEGAGCGGYNVTKTTIGFQSECKPSKSHVFPNEKEISKAATQAHIVFFMVDDWGFNDIGFRSSYVDFTTPAMDGMKDEGINLERYYGAPSCSPARAMFLTGRYSHKIGFHRVPGGPHPNLNVKFATLGDELRNLGYHTVGLGKWHMGFDNWTYHPLWRGFDEYYGFFSGFGGFYGYETFELGLGSTPDMFENENPAPERFEGLHCTLLLMHKARQYIAAHAEMQGTKPLFMYYAMHSAHNDHTGFSATDEYEKMCTVTHTSVDKTETEQMVAYCGMLLMMDAAVDDVLLALREYDMIDKSIVVISGDNGGKAWEPVASQEAVRKKWAALPGMIMMMLGSAYGSSYPLRGGKQDQSEGSYRVNGVVYSPGFVEGNAVGTTYKGLVHTVDWYPTFLKKAAGEGYPVDKSIDDGVLDGFDMWPAFMDGSEPRDEVVLTWPRAIIQKDPTNSSRLYKAVFFHLSARQGPDAAERPAVFFEPNQNTRKARFFEGKSDLYTCGQLKTEYKQNACCGKPARLLRTPLKVV